MELFWIGTIISCLCVYAVNYIKKIKQFTPQRIFCKIFAEHGIKFIHRKDLKRNTDVKYHMIINDSKVFDRMLKNGQLGLAESYVDKDWDSDDLQSFLLKITGARKEIKKQMMENKFSLMIYFIQKINPKEFSLNTILKAKTDIQAHYDAQCKDELMVKMLGKIMNYTCAYFHEPNMTLDEAQYAKMELIASKLDLKPGMKVLDIGCGYGQMAYHLASKYSVQVVGVTLSQNQKNFADAQFKHELVEIVLTDYRDVDVKDGLFDRIYSVGMFEAIGKKNFKEYYDKCDELLKPEGIMFIHTIGTKQRKWNHDSFINKYIFPGGELPHLKDLTHRFSDKWVLQDLQNIGISYHKTLNCWIDNVDNWKGLDLKQYNEKFRRVWMYYLHQCSVVFATEFCYLWHLVYTKAHSKRMDNCDYMNRKLKM